MSGGDDVRCSRGVETAGIWRCFGYTPLSVASGRAIGIDVGGGGGRLNCVRRSLRGRRVAFSQGDLLIMAHTSPDQHASTEPTGSGTKGQHDASDARAHQRRPGFFESDHLQAELRGRAMRGGAITMIAQALRVGVRLIGLGVLAHFFVDTQEFGILYAVLPIVGFVTLFREAGLATATMQRGKLPTPKSARCSGSTWPWAQRWQPSSPRSGRCWRGSMDSRPCRR